METYGVVDDSIMSHPRKRMLSPSRSKCRRITENSCKQYVDESFYEFKRKVLAGRPGFRKGNEDALAMAMDRLSRSSIRAAMWRRARFFTRPPPFKFGLVDRLGFIEDAIERVAELAELDIEQTRVVEYSRPAPWLEIPFLSKAEASNQILGTLMELNTTRAYYLSSQPAAAGYQLGRPVSDKYKQKSSCMTPA